MGPAHPLPLDWVRVDDYGSRIGCDSEARSTLHQVIRALDREWRRLTEERLQEKVATKEARQE